MEKRALVSSSNLVWGALDRPGDNQPHLRWWDDGSYIPITWDEWRRGAERSAAGLQALGVCPGDRVAAVLTNGIGVGNAIIGAWLAGATLLSLPTPRRGMTFDEYRKQLEDLCRSTHAQVLLLEDRFAALLGAETLGTSIASFDSAVADTAPRLAPLADDAPAFVQFSSGSTSNPKGILLTMGAVCAQEQMAAERLNIDAHKQALMWLPLSHDLGLFGGLLLSWTAGIPLAISTPERFLKYPNTWLDDAYELGATLTGGPNFGLALATRRALRTPPKGRCPLRTIVLGGERVELATLQAAAEVLGPFGVTFDTFTPAYGLAEGTLAVAIKRDGEAPRAVWIDRESAYRGELSIAAEGASGVTPVISCGPPLSGVSLSVGETQIGKVRLRSPSLAEGYLNDPLNTAKHFVDGEFLTEDLGFLHEGELCVLGRTDDVILFAGRNVYARDIEREIEAHNGVRPGCAVLIDEQNSGQPHIVLLAEPSASAADFGKLADEVARTAFRSGGLHVAECVFVRQGQLPKTPSGKVQRFRCRTLLADKNDAVLERVEL